MPDTRGDGRLRATKRSTRVSLAVVLLLAGGYAALDDIARRNSPVWDETHALFVSATNLAGVYNLDRYAWLKPFAPLDVVGGTIWVFDLDAIPDDRKWR